MADEYRQSRKKINPSEIRGMPVEMDEEDVAGILPDALQKVREVQDAMAGEVGQQVKMPPMMAAGPDAPFQIGGKMPPEFRAALQQRGTEPRNVTEGQKPRFGDEEDGHRPQPSKRKRPTPDRAVVNAQSSQLSELLAKLEDKKQWELFDFPSLGKFYTDIPAQIAIRPMTGEEEQILATPRFIRRGKAIDMIFSRCIRENINPSQLLSVDRTHLLIYLRGISYTPEYDVEIKCPECTTKFSTVIDLNSLEVESCPNEFGPDSLEGELPHSGLSFSYRLATGIDEQAVTNYRDKRIQMFGDQSEDDTWLYRTAILLNEIQGISNPKEIQLLMKRLPIADVAHLRNEVNNPPFGVNTSVPMMCPSCAAEFEIDLPLEASFFFPRKKEKTQA